MRGCTSQRSENRKYLIKSTYTSLVLIFDTLEKKSLTFNACCLFFTLGKTVAVSHYVLSFRLNFSPGPMSLSFLYDHERDRKPFRLGYT